MRYYRKELPNNPVRLPNGLVLKGEVFAFDQPSIIEAVDAMVAKQIGGFVPIEKPEYEELLKKKEQRGSQPPAGNHSRFIRPQPSLSRSAAAGAEPAFAQAGSVVNAVPVNAPQPEPLKVPVFKPTAGRADK